MHKLDIAALCFGMFLFAALTTSKAGLIIDDFSYPVSSVSCQASGLDGHNENIQVIPSGGRMALVAIVSSDGTASTDIGGGSASFINAASTTATHQIVWRRTIPFDIVALSGSADTLGFVLDVVSANVSSLFIITVREGGNKYAQYSAAVSGPGQAHFTFSEASTTRPVLADEIWFNLDPATLPSGEISFVFDGLTAVSTVPEPTNVALGLFGALSLTVGGVRMGRRLMIARRTG